ncbi:hypothetical protein [Phytohalomonas tamaricis]|uniref:hypothetical protein n=1 Tax=Phytohalomonas tamaricis TaxID=2081032 RepID=UPI000D0BA001|nr:hypothetical protein [Phytohalomonas tamaricis]
MSILNRPAGAYTEYLIRGEWITINQASKKYGISPGALRNRLHQDDLTEEQLLKPVVRRKPAFTSGAGQRYETRYIHPLLTSLFRDYGKRKPVAVQVKLYSDEARQRKAS